MIRKKVATMATPLMSLITQQITVTQELSVSYIVAIHIWMIICFLFMFGALCELLMALKFANQIKVSN